MVALFMLCVCDPGLFAGFALFSAFGWLATIPSWAAVIILLLVLIYLK